MCGICGTVGIADSHQATDAIARMKAAMLNRGPDGEGELVCPQPAPQVALGMRRLSIIDLPGGHQPIFNEDGNLAVVFNGEIYNFPALRTELERAGHQFRTRSDTEVIVHTYEQWGDGFLEHLVGMFAFALLDMRAQPPTLVLARDRLGIKPLYYTIQDGVLVFASEVRALLASGLVSRRLSVDALRSYLLFGSVAEPVSLVENVFSLPPGHWAKIAAGAAPHEVSAKPYWTFGGGNSPEVSSGPTTLDSAAKELRLLLEQAVECHLLADVPLGVFLSSGLDSAAIVALASRARSELHSFTVVFKELEFSEGEVARSVARRFRTQHQEMLLEGHQMLERLSEAVQALDQPTMDGINSYIVSWAAHRVGLKVALSGLGGDEVFGGYSTFAATRRLQTLMKVGRPLPRALVSVVANAAGRVRRSSKDARRKLGALLADGGAFPHPYFWTRVVFTPGQSSALLAAGSFPTRESMISRWRQWNQDTVQKAASLDWFSGISCLEARTYMVQTLLRDTDSVSMASSLEVRVPLLDHRLVDFVSALPPAAKQRAGVQKALLVESLRDLLPPEIVRLPKRTFTFPWEVWLRGPLKSRVRDSLAQLSPALTPYLDQQAVNSIWEAYCGQQTNWSRPWTLYVLNEWCQRHLSSTTAI
jgi:asparagine synthase (glutamine-hydrolysing)